MHRIVLVGVLSALSVGPVTAQRIVTEAEFLSALDPDHDHAVHPAIAESSEALAVARARIAAASAFDNPTLSVVREDPNGPVEQMDLTLSWQLPGMDRRPTIAARKEAADAAVARRQQQVLSLRLSMKEIYANWAFTTARHERLAAQAERVAALAERERLRAERGEASGLEAHRLELAASSLRSRVALAIAGAEQARANAAGWAPELPPDALPTLPALSATPEPREDHPLVRAAAKDLAAAMLEREAGERFIRSPEISLGWQRQEARVESIDGPTLGLAWSVPVFARNRAEKIASEARVAGARARLERVRQELEPARTGAKAAFQRLATALDNARAALGGNARMLDGTEAAFRHGEASLTDLLETHRSVTESELVVLDLHAAALAAHRELERVTGDVDSTNTLSDSEPNHQENLP